MSKPELKLTPASRVYYIKFRAHSVRFIIALVLLSWVIIGSLVAVFYGLTMPAIWLALIAMFLTLVCVVEFKASDAYYDKHLREMGRDLHAYVEPDYTAFKN